MRRSLIVYVRAGVNLPDEDGFLHGESDPYVFFKATNVDGGIDTKETFSRYDDENPDWYQYLYFTIDTWKTQIFDYDTSGSSDTLSIPMTYAIESGEHKFIKLCAFNNCKGYIEFDYTFE